MRRRISRRVRPAGESNILDMAGTALDIAIGLSMVSGACPVAPAILNKRALKVLWPVKKLFTLVRSALCR